MNRNKATPQPKIYIKIDSVSAILCQMMVFTLRSHHSFSLIRELVAGSFSVVLFLIVVALSLFLFCTSHFCLCLHQRHSTLHVEKQSKTSIIQYKLIAGRYLRNLQSIYIYKLNQARFANILSSVGYESYDSLFLVGDAIHPFHKCTFQMK